MRTELNEMSDKLRVTAARRGSKAIGGQTRTAQASELEPHAVDAAFADETMPMLKERASRRDHSHALSDDRVGAADGGASDSDDALLRSLAAQLDLLHHQQREIRLLLDQAGRRRVDRVGS